MKYFGESIFEYYIELIKIFLSKCYLVFIRRPLWRKLNKNNRITIKHNFDFKKVNIGNYTYGELDIDEYYYENSYLTIGNYCSIGPNVKFICGNHIHSHFSTYPFGSIIGRGRERIKNIDNIINKEHISKPIVIDDDVRIGVGAKIMAGVHIGQGAVIAAGAVVTKDIPPYAIAGGVPAKVIKYRFSEDKIKKLLKIDYSNIPIEKFREIYLETIKEDFDIDIILKSVS